jgi:hypothetical protein
MSSISIQRVSIHDTVSQLERNLGNRVGRGRLDASGLR